MERYSRYIDRCTNFDRYKVMPCYICENLTTKNNGNETWEKHIAGPLHRLVLDSFKESFDQCSTRRVTCKICSKFFFKENVIEHAIEHKLAPWYKSPDVLMKFFFNFITEIDDQYYCHLCNEQFLFWYSALLHVDTHEHQEYHRNKIDYDIDNEKDTYTVDYQLLINHGIFRKNLQMFECMICKQSIGGHQNIDEHIKDHSHLENQTTFINKLEEQEKIINDEICSKNQVLSTNNLVTNKENTSSNITKDTKSGSDKLKNNEKFRSRKFKTDAKSDSKELASPLCQLIELVYGLKDADDNITCKICKKVVEDSTKFYIHVTCHLWQIFPDKCNEIRVQLQPVDDQYLPSELNLNNTSVNQPGGNSLKKIGITLAEIDELKKQLARLDISTEKESLLKDYQIKIQEEFENLVHNEWLSHPLFQQFRKLLKIIPPIQNHDVELISIYEIDEKQLENIKLGTKLSLYLKHIDKFYCIVCRVSMRNSVGYIYEHFASIGHYKSVRRAQNDFIWQTPSITWNEFQLAQEFIERVLDSCIQCWACDETIEKYPKSMKEHIDSKVHKNNCVIHLANAEKLSKSLQAGMSRNWYNVEIYWCIICDELFSDEINFINHLSELTHKEEYSHHKSEELIFDFCPTCAILWFGFRNSFGHHLHCKMHRYLVKHCHYYITELPEGTLELLSAAGHICNLLLAEIDCNIDDEKSKEKLLIKDLKKIAKQRFPRAEIYPFGSRVYGLGSKNSDMDVFIDCQNRYKKINSRYGIMNNLSAIQASLETNSDKWIIKQTLTDNVTVPIIKTCHKPTGIECDISFTSGLTTEKTKLIKSYIEAYPLSRKLIIFMKIWIKKCNLSLSENGCRGLGSFAVTWMVIFYLQCKNILPSVNKLIELKQKSRLIGEWEVGVIKQFEVQSTNQDFLQLLIGLFNFYSQFNYKYEVMCPLLGKTIEKEKFKPSELPSAMDPYKRYLKGIKPERFRVSRTMCLQDPFDLSQNLAKSVSKFATYQLKTFCFLSAQILEKYS